MPDFKCLKKLTYILEHFDYLREDKGIRSPRIQ